MGFVAKSAFWLGVVYSAMPFDLGKPSAISPMTAAMPYAASYTLGAFASEAATTWRRSTGDRRSAAAANPCARNCAQPELGSGRSNESSTLKDRRNHGADVFPRGLAHAALAGP